MKSDVLFANSKQIMQDISAKMNDTTTCIQLFNKFYHIQKELLSDLYYDPNKKDPKVPEFLQVWNQEDFGAVVKVIDTLLDETREDNLTCTQLMVDMKDRMDLNRVKSTILGVAKKFNAEGTHAQMNQNWISWVRGLSFSLQTWSDVLGQRLQNAVGLFEDVTELLFLSDRMFPFVLEQVRKTATEGKFEMNNQDKAPEWKDLSSFLKAMDIRLSHLRARLGHKWPEGAKAVQEMELRAGRIKKIVAFLWGEVSAKRIYSKLTKEIGDLGNVISRVHLDKNFRYDKNALSSLADKVFCLVEDFGSHENHFLKYKALDVSSIRDKVIGLRDAYEKLCMRLSNFPEDENLLRSKQGGEQKPKISTPGGIIGKQAAHPELNDLFTRTGIVLLTRPQKHDRFREEQSFRRPDKDPVVVRHEAVHW